MGCSMKILTGIGTYEPEDFQDEDDRKDTIADLKEELESELLSEYSGEIGYFKEYFPDLEADSQELILGCERPDELRAVVQAWNADIRENCARELENIEVEMRRHGYDSLSQMIRNYREMDQFGAMVDLKYPASVYNLRKALDAFDNHFSYGNGRKLVHVDHTLYDGQYCNAHCVLIPEELEKDVLEHPESYLLIELVYD